MRYLYRALLLLLAAFVLLNAQGEAQAQSSGALYLVEVDGIISAPTTAYVRRALDQAEAAGATALIIQLGSQGGVLRELRALARDLHDAKVPVVVYVAPGGSESGAAGALLLSAAHIAAMAPDTSFGSPYPLARFDALLSEETRQLLLDDLSLQLRSWNTERGRSAEWVDVGVREGVIVDSARAAADPPAIDVVAPSLQELLALLEGRRVVLADGSDRELRALGQTPRAVAPTAWEQLRLFLADPTVAFVLFVLGAIAIVAELANPGTAIFAGIGGVLLVAAVLGSFLVLPVQPLAVAALVGAFALIAADLFVPSHGGLTVAGLALLVVGGLNLIDPVAAPGAGVAVWAIVVVALSLGALGLAGLYLVVKGQRRPVATGREALIGMLAEVRQPLDPEGLVFVDGALWRAVSAEGTVPKGSWVKVTAVDGLRLIVQQLE